MAFTCTCSYPTLYIIHLHFNAGSLISTFAPVIDVALVLHRTI